MWQVHDQKCQQKTLKSEQIYIFSFLFKVSGTTVAEKMVLPKHVAEIPKNNCKEKYFENNCKEKYFENNCKEEYFDYDILVHIYF